ncbi:MULTISPECIES: UDP-N-acetylmuramoyl-L-alanyl-D-glutamate--2,6-diaminopimelate ligase [unclassified Apibacter]|uniref:UDP-N-acetylmuramoyl-L-alanyl-D-glutamate--2, 6-diaminopimelate ligase n=1 Tax=unclassified Apibacter TaxID=2630820 RepID=UPI001326C283|nr:MULTISPECIES: UDP-N-acetylmuramoyl-L-alanyl-D-glutamate--2,6-diaminopimelate ligase [unclassified Apibacter]MCX8677261.1 UDP-N-acetylmuramoyl-L-alanyl-D-glutamate--2,6-diaminopimelate ligase [Apibacter sp. B3919]MXO23685.1 UDP-N-acetylmuramoyl-L-alanyl-D-glutamate--2,6-diaminopimelate ligase [Apibacter sp. B3924]MXO26734.1 UDP-N-acetylmuramoyl-L-alanyl-D-glutamate--2,6-diaminopimelate ligase [Apibacter sp. B3813]MXO28696.1 UDP-N-acetylmuramoyl-L-alanyl-D-glutamate--2,6-diaminopimelate ligase
MKKLSDLLYKVSIEKLIGNVGSSIKNISFDSRKIESGYIFFAIKGYDLDGHKYIPQAIIQGASVVVCEELPEELSDYVTYVQVKNSSIALGIVASNFYDNPSEKLTLAGITGTNGKTTTTTLLYNLFTQLGFRCALLSTIENRISDKVLNSNHTTPDPITINQLLAQAVDEGCQYAFMEVSSHGIHQNRLAGLTFKIGAFTNITHDHLDYHQTFSNYIAAKKKFFDELPKTAIAITNMDDKNGLIMLQNTNAKKVTYSLKSNSEYKGKIIENRLDGMLLQFNNQEFWTVLAGKFNAYNELLAYTIASELGFDSLDIVTALSKLQRVKGRFETYVSDDKKYIIVDYAHTPDALQNILEAINQSRTRNEKLITVFGCGGHRDKEKRPKMGNIATRLSDLAIITSDNPRDENPDEIIQEIETGIEPQNTNKYLSITDRKQAIRTAIKMAAPKDIILIAGKGHENYQEINGKHFPFDDMKIAKELLKNT